MKKFLLLFLFALFMTSLPGFAEDIIFSMGDTKGLSGVPTSSNSTLSTWKLKDYQFESKYCYNSGSYSYLMMTSNNNAYLKLPIFDKPIKSITIKTTNGMSQSATINLRSGSQTGTLLASGIGAGQSVETEINETEAGGSYFITNTSTKNAQIESIIISLTEEKDNENGNVATLTGDSFNNFTAKYQVYYTKPDSYGYTYAAFAYKSGGLQINSNRAACGIVVSTIGSDYIIAAIDVNFGTANGIDIYKKGSAFTPSSVEGTAISLSGATKLNGNTTIKADVTNYAINDNAFAIIPNGGNNIITSITVYYKSKSGGSTDTKVDLTKFEYTSTTAEYDINPSVTGQTLPTLEILPANADITVTYKSSEESVATVDTKGNVTPLAKGETTITATFAGNSEYNKAEASYTLTVTDSTPVTPPTPGEDLGYKLITNLDELGDEAEIIIVNTETKLAIGTTQNSNNRSAGKVTFGAGNLTADPEDDVAIIKAKKVSDGNYTLYVTNGDSKGYLYAGSSSKNYLYTRNVNSDNNSVASITFNNGTTIKFIGSNTNSTLQYNPNNNNPIFSCYGSASQKPVVIYKKTAVETQPDLVLGELTYTVTGGKTIEDDTIIVDFGDEFTFSAENASNIEVKVDDETANGKYENGTYSWTIDKYYDAAYVVVTATLGDDSKSLEFLLDVNCPLPSKPILKIGETVLEGDSKVVSLGTEVTIECENAVSLEGIIGDIEINADNSTLPYKFTVNGETTVYVFGVNAKGQEGEDIEFTFTIGEIDSNMPAVGSNFKQLLKGDEYKIIENAYYIIGRNSVNGEDISNIAMSKTAGSNNITSTRNVTSQDIHTGIMVNTNKERVPVLMTTTDNDVLILKYVKQGEEYGLKTVNLGNGFVSEQKYLYAPEDAVDLGFSDEFKPVIISITDQDYAEIKFRDTDKRSIQTPSTGNHFNYQSSATRVQLFKYTTAKQFIPAFEDLTIAVNDPYPIEINDEHPDIVYTVVGNTTAITIDGNVITASDREKDVDVKATWEETDEWFEGEARFKVSVKQRFNADTFFFRYETVYGKKDVGVLSQAVYYTGDYSEVRYRSSDPDEIIVDEFTGMIRPDDIKNAIINKPYTITASVNETDAHFPAETSYTLYIEEAQPGAPGDEILYSLKDSFGDNENQETWSGQLPDAYSKSYPTAKEVQSPFSDIEYTIYRCMIQQMNNKWFIQLNSEGGYLSFKIPENCVSISLKAGQSQSSSAKVKISFNDKENNEYDFSKDFIVYIPSEYRNGESTMKIIASSQTPKIASLTFNIGEAPKPSIELSYPAGDKGEARIINTFQGQQEIISGLILKNASFNEVDFDIDEINEMDEEENFQNYVITRNDDEQTVAVTVNDPGVYTFRAFIAEKDGDNYIIQENGSKIYKAMAILRLNVFPTLTVEPTEDGNGSLANDDRTNAPNLTIAVSDENGQVTIGLPSVEELEDQYKYSTIHVSGVTIKHKAVEGGAIVSSETTLSREDLALEENKTHDFTTDGSVTYSLTYANTEDFTGNAEVHVILHPVLDGSRDDNNGYINPSVNSYVQYYVFEFDPNDPKVPVPNAPNPFEEAAQNAPRRVDGDNASGWQMGALGEPINFRTLTSGVSGGMMRGVTYRIVKSINEVAEDNIVEDTLLATEYSTFATNGEGVVTAIDGIEADASTTLSGDEVFFNLQGVKIDKPEKGVIYIIVKDGKSQKIIF